MFGFYGKNEIIPEIFHDLHQQKINCIFLNLYNALVDDEMKIAYKYVYKANSLRNIFELKIKDMLNQKPLNFKRAKSFCPYSHKIIQAFLMNEFSLRDIGVKIPKTSLARLIYNVFFNDGFMINTQFAFESFVLDKISKSNQNIKINFIKDIIILDNKIAIKVCFAMDKNNDIQGALKFIQENNFEKFYIVYPRNKNFTQCMEIKHFLCENKKTLLKLVPYTINNQILRRK
ncbi:hypothetical protein [Campylobacter peloridis]|uniref:hypothetical protein n=1 Tax=Campylobacter peloridis TaxID=488546 RepID=UPI001C735C56|nr:hypothetical protein [Campylobacter peloridis]MBX1885506.1 hypothetical protein [Campylobacter peloridis]